MPKTTYLLFFIFPLYATLTKPLSVGLETGYEQKALSWYLKEEGGALTYKEEYQTLESFTARLRAQKVYRDIFFELGGDFSATGKGKLEQDLSSTFTYQTTGISYSVFTSLGLLANLTPDRCYQIILVPHFCYQYYTSSLCRQDPSPMSSLIDDQSEYQELYPRLDKNLKNQFYGPSLGIELWVKPNCPIKFELGDSYTWLRLDSTFSYQESIKTFLSGALVETTEILSEAKVSEGGNLQHQGFIRALTLIDKCWDISIGSYFYYISSGVHEIDVKQNSQTIREKYKLRATRFSILVGIRRYF